MSTVADVYATIPGYDTQRIVIRRFPSQIPWRVEWGLLETCGYASSSFGVSVYFYHVPGSFEKAKELLAGCGWTEVPGDQLPEPEVPDAVLGHQAWEQGALAQRAACAEAVRKMRFGGVEDIEDPKVRFAIEDANKSIEACAETVEETEVVSG